MRRNRAVRACIVAVVATLTVGVVGAGPAGAQAGRPGVTPTTINVGGMAGVENFVGQPYASGFDGVQAYFNYINAKGGAFGHKFKLIAKLDDQDSPSQDLIQARSLVEEKHVFAVLPVVVDNFSAGSYLARSGVPTFGWNINAQWATGYPTVGSAYPAGCSTRGVGPPCTGSGAPNLFGEKGSFLCFDCPQEAPAYLAQQVGARNVAILAYTVPQSAQCANGMEAGFRKFGLNVVRNDKSLTPGFTDLGSDVDAMKAGNVQFVGTCMDVGANVRVAQALRRAGLTNAKFYAPQGYDPTTLKKYGSELNGFYFGIDFMPFQSINQSPGMTRWAAQMNKLGKPLNEQALAGWINADLLYQGIKAAGPNFTQASVVNAINHINGYTADNIIYPINWAVDHGPGPEACTAYVAVINGKFVPQFGKPGQPWVCSQNFPLPDALNSSTLYYRPPKPTDVLPPSATIPTTTPPPP
ncbi:MAG TPA: ABC transporter substrate-binding protein [Acidimicrobiia bacterium]|jgi:ABC-type branched-subunit amino acid transport system substrate-binding protein|nr:ABC transporter substrate-binding protein [Acidimicrobiia bacterium]